MPTTKSFEHTIRFDQVPGGPRLPLVTVKLIQPNGTRVGLSLLFDTGASTTTFRQELFPLLGLERWDSGPAVEVVTAGGAEVVVAHRYRVRLELLGKTVDAAVNLQALPHNPLFVGLLGREDVFEQFGFGFWESTGELLATVTP